jgi:hypothetical protein
MIHWYERVLGPVIGGGAIWLFGLGQRHGNGYQVFVRYFAGWAFGIFALIAMHDLLEPMFSGRSLIIGFVWTGIVGFVLWKRHLA